MGVLPQFSFWEHANERINCRFISLAVVAFAADAPAVTMDWVPVNDAGNASDTAVMQDGTTGYGSVGYDYRIATTDVTDSQYAEFLNAVDPTVNTCSASIQ